jgi:hypothetical protein
MSKALKALLLATCAGFCSILFWDLVLRISNGNAISLYEYLDNLRTWRRIQDVFGFFLLGFVPCLIFGTPVLLIIEKWYSRFKTRYITGGFVAGWIAWFFMVGPLLTTSPWLSPDSWVDSGINYVGLYVWLGFSTGLLFTILLGAMGKLDEKKA